MSFSFLANKLFFDTIIFSKMIAWKDMLFGLVFANLACILIPTRSHIFYLRSRQYVIAGNTATINFVEIKSENLIVMFSYQNSSAYMEELILPGKKTSIWNNIPSIKYSNYQIRSYEKNIFNMS